MVEAGLSLHTSLRFFTHKAINIGSSIPAVLHLRAIFCTNSIKTMYEQRLQTFYYCAKVPRSEQSKSSDQVSFWASDTLFMYSSYDGGSEPLLGDATDPSLVVTNSSCHLCVIRTMSNVSGESGKH